MARFVRASRWHGPCCIEAVRKRILVADDDDLTREFIDRVLTDAGFDTVAAADGLEALQAIRGTHLDAVVTDASMPRMSGIQMLRTARYQGHAIPFVLISAIEAQLLEQVTSGLSGITVLRKPVTVRQLRETIARVIT